jgi:small subunit ribosomal protein S1
MDFVMTEETSAEGKAETEAQEGRGFENLLDEFTPERPKRGQFLKGEVLRIEDDAILMDVGAKRDAVVTPKEIGKLEEDLVESIAPGDQLPVCVLRTPIGSERLLVSIERGLEQEDWDRAEELLESSETVEPTISGMNKGGLEANFGRLRGFIPNSHIPGLPRGAGKDKIIAFKKDKIGSEMLVKVIEVNRRKRRLILSAREAHKEARAKRLRELEPSETIRGRVVNIVDFGAFVSLGGVDGLVHISELDRSRVDNPSDVVTVGEEIEVKILDVDVERERVSLSRKALLPSPWDDVDARYDVGQLVEGTVTNVRDFGAFVLLEDGIEGMIHRSEIGAGGTGRPQDVVRSGDRVLARVTRIEADRERMGLSLRQVTYDEQLEWMEKEQARSEREEEVAEMPAEEPTAETEEAEMEAEVEAEGEAAAAESEPEAEAPEGAEMEAEVEAEGEAAAAESEPEAEAPEGAEMEAEVEAEGEAAAAESEPEAEAPEEAEMEAEFEVEGEADAVESEPEAPEGAEMEAEAAEEASESAEPEEEKGQAD